MKSIYTTVTTSGILLIAVFLLITKCALFSETLHEGPEHSDSNLRVVIFDFTALSENIHSGIISRVFRNEFHKRNRFSVLDIEEINKDLTARQETVRNAAEKRKRAVYIGTSIDAHKIIIGDIITTENRERLTVDVIDVKTGNSVFSMHHDEERMSSEKTAVFANTVADRILGIETLPAVKEGNRLGGIEKKSPGNHAVGISIGVLSPWRKIEPYLNSMLLTKAHYTFPTGIYNNTDIDTSIGYARTGTKDSIAGTMEMVFVPVTVNLAAGFPVFSASWMPVPVLYGGCGLTYLSLSGTAGKQGVSKQGVDITATAGMGLSFTLTDTLFIQLQAMLYYLYEDIEVTYYYYGVMVRYRL